jgi:transcriptional regulator with XRE-family HTH domain
MKPQSDLAAVLRGARKRRGLTLREVEEKTGVSNAYLSQVENGKIRQPSPAILHKLSDVYDVSYEDLLDSAGYPVPHGVVPRNTASNQPLNRLGRITKDEEVALAEYLQFLRGRKRR